jgi:hypothetical protein
MHHLHITLTVKEGEPFRIPEDYTEEDLKKTRGVPGIAHALAQLMDKEEHFVSDSCGEKCPSNYRNRCCLKFSWGETLSKKPVIDISGKCIKP